MMEKTQLQQVKTHLRLLSSGEERGLSFFYDRFYSYFLFRTCKATQDECAAESIVQEAFLRLWLFRENVDSEHKIFQFLKTQVKSAIDTFYRKNRNRFNRSLLRLDSIDEYQEFMLAYELEEEEMDLVYLDQLEKEKQEKLDTLNKIILYLTQEQQLFIQLCLKYSFNYERIAYYLGGISDYEVGMKIEKAIQILRSVVNNTERMTALSKPSKVVLNGEINEQQSEIFRMRYELQLSFEQISEALNLSAATVKRLFVEAHTKIKQTKQTA